MTHQGFTVFPSLSDWARNLELINCNFKCLLTTTEQKRDVTKLNPIAYYPSIIKDIPEQT